MGRADRIWGKLATKLLGKVAPGKAAEWRSGLQGESAPVTRSISLPVLCGLLLRFSYGQHLSSFTCTYRLETQPFLSQSVLCLQVQEFDTPSIRRLCQKASREIIDIVQLDLQEYFKSRDSVCKPPPAMEVIYKKAERLSFTFNIVAIKTKYTSNSDYQKHKTVFIDHGAISDRTSKSLRKRCPHGSCPPSNGPQQRRRSFHDWSSRACATLPQRRGKS